MFVFLRRTLMVSVLWVLLSGGAVIVCSTGDGYGDNAAPVARDDEYSVPAGMTLVGSARATDADGDVLTYRVVSGPTLGRLESFNAGTGGFRYVCDTPGSDSFEFRASDGRRDSGTGRVRIEVTQAPQSRIVALAATVAGPVVLAGDGLFLLGPDGSRELRGNVSAMEPAGGGWRVTDASGRTTCLDPWGDSRGRCGVSDTGGLEDPFVQGRWLRLTGGRTGLDVEERWGAGTWKVLSTPFEPSVPAALHFDVSSPGRIWVAGYRAGASLVWGSDDAGATWRVAGEVPGRITSLAGLGTGRPGILALRAPPLGPVLLAPGWLTAGGSNE